MSDRDPETARGHLGPESEAPLVRITRLVNERKRLEDEVRAVTHQVKVLLREAHDSGHSWSEIAEAAGYRNADVAMSMAPKRSEPTVGDGHPANSYTVTEAARLLGVTTQAIYTSIKAGRLQTVDDRKHRRRVIITDAPRPE